MVNDRRKGIERRAFRRYSVRIDIEWEGLIGRQQGTISDISSFGCFVLCSGEVENGETVKLLIPVRKGMKIQIFGEVVNHVFEIGYGMRFVKLNEAQRGFLEKLISKLG